MIARVKRSTDRVKIDGQIVMPVMSRVLREPASIGHRRRPGRGAPYAMDDDFIIGDFVKNQVRIRASDKTAQALAAGAGSGVPVVKREIDKPGLRLAAHVAATVSQYSRALCKDRLEREACSGSFKARILPKRPALLHPRRLHAAHRRCRRLPGIGHLVLRQFT